MRSPRSARRGRRGEDRGAITVEFALIVPIFVMLIVGLLEFGRAYNVQISIQGAAREGARALALKQSSTVVETAVRTAAPSVSNLTVTQTPCSGSGGTATVVVKSAFTFSIPFVKLGSRTLTATSSMRCGL